MTVDPILLWLIIFIGTFLIVYIRSIHCPSWQLPLGVSFLFGALVLTFVSRVTWSEAGFSWMLGVGGAILVRIIKNKLIR